MAGNRCEQCCKFVGLDNGDPEINDHEATISGGDIEVRASVRSVRNCAECGSEMKAIDIDLEETVPVDDSWEGWKELSELDQGFLKEELKEDTGAVELETSEGTSSMDEGGGSRYKKNMITTTLEVEVTLNWDGNKLTKTVELTSENAASEFEDQQ